MESKADRSDRAGKSRVIALFSNGVLSASITSPKPYTVHLYCDVLYDFDGSNAGSFSFNRLKILDKVFIGEGRDGGSTRF